MFPNFVHSVLKKLRQISAVLLINYINSIFIDYLFLFHFSVLVSFASNVILKTNFQLSGERYSNSSQSNNFSIFSELLAYRSFKFLN